MANIPADFVAEVRDALSVSSSYDARIELGVRRTLLKLLRDYNFPKTVMRSTSAGLGLGVISAPAPAGLKKPLLVQLIESSAPPKYLELHRAAGFRPAQPNGAPRYYWLQGTQLAWDTPLGEAGLLLDVFYQSLDVDAAIGWFFTEYPDVLKSYAVYRIAGDMRKGDVAALYQGYSQDDLASIAVFLNELEWNTVEFDWRERETRYTPRYGC